MIHKFKFYFLLFCSAVLLFSCNKADGIDEVPIRDFDVQYQDDIEMIEDYLTTHYIQVSPDQEVTMGKITETENFPSMMSYLVEGDTPSNNYPQLRKKSFEYNDKTYELYYFKLRADNTDPAAKSPSRVDGVWASYRGTYLKYTTETLNEGEENEETITTLSATLFEFTPNPSDFLYLDASIRGWTEVLPFFKSGNAVAVDGQPTVYNDFGSGVMFIPSGFAYFYPARTSPISGITIPAYSPLVFTFKLLDVKYGDQDFDGIISNNEFDGDTDGDGTKNLYDADDDGDGYFTQYEIIKNEDGTVTLPDFTGNGIPDYLDPETTPDNQD